MGDELGFGLIVTLNNQVSGPAAAAGRSFTDLEELVNLNAKKINASMEMMGTGAMVMGVALAGLIPIGKSINAAITMDGLMRGLTAVAGSSEEAERQLKNLEKVAKLPGLGFKEAIEGSISLQAAGSSAEFAERSMMAFGNALATVGKGKVALAAVNAQITQMMTKTQGWGSDLRIIREWAPQTSKAMLAAFGSIDAGELSKAGVTGKMAIEGILRELEKLPSVSGGIGNAIENLEDQAFRGMVAVGKALTPILEPLVNMVSYLLEQFRAFAETDIGAVFTVIITSVLLLTFAFGALVFVMGFAKGMTARLSQGFISMGMTQLGTIISTVGLTGAMTMLATATWAALVPLAPFIAGGLIIIAVMYGIYKAIQYAIKSFDDLASGGELAVASLSPFMHFMQVLGGAIRGIMEIWSSADGTGFEFSKKTEDALNRLGILDYMINLGTWLVRIKNLFRGVWDGLGTPLDALSGSFGKWMGAITGKLLPALGQLFGSVIKIGQAFGFFDNDMDKGVGTMDLWFEVGKRLIEFVLTPLIFGFTLLGTILSGLIGIISGVISVISWLINSVIDIFTGKKSLSEVGHEFVNGILSGIIEAWGWLKQQLIDLIGALPFGDKFLGSIGITAPDGNVSQPTGEPNATDAMANTITNNKLATAKPTVIDKSTQSTEVRDINFKVELDSEEIVTKMKQKEEFNSTRD